MKRRSKGPRGSAGVQDGQQRDANSDPDVRDGLRNEATIRDIHKVILAGIALILLTAGLLSSRQRANENNEPLPKNSTISKQSTNQNNEPLPKNSTINQSKRLAKFKLKKMWDYQAPPSGSELCIKDEQMTLKRAGSPTKLQRRLETLSPAPGESLPHKSRLDLESLEVLRLRASSSQHMGPNYQSNLRSCVEDLGQSKYNIVLEPTPPSDGAIIIDKVLLSPLGWCIGPNSAYHENLVDLRIWADNPNAAPLDGFEVPIELDSIRSLSSFARPRAIQYSHSLSQANFDRMAGLLEGLKAGMDLPDRGLREDACTEADRQCGTGAVHVVTAPDGVVVSLLHRYTQNYWHFLSISLPRLLKLRLMLTASQLQLQWIAVQEDRPKFVSEIIGLLGYSENIVEVPRCSLLFANRVALPPRSDAIAARTSWHPQGWTTAIIDRMHLLDHRAASDTLLSAIGTLEPDGLQPLTALLIDRRKKEKRNLQAPSKVLAEMRTAIEKNIFVDGQQPLVPPEEVTFCENSVTSQIKLFRSVGAVVAVNGACLGNMFFAPKGGAFVTIYPLKNYRPFDTHYPARECGISEALLTARNFGHHYAVIELPDVDHDKAKNIRVPDGLVQKALQWALEQTQRSSRG